MYDFANSTVAKQTTSGLGSRGSRPMEAFEKRCCPATTGAPLHSVAAMHRSLNARSALRGLLATNPRGWRLEHQVIYLCSHSSDRYYTDLSFFDQSCSIIATNNESV